MSGAYAARRRKSRGRNPSSASIAKYVAALATIMPSRAPMRRPGVTFMAAQSNCAWPNHATAPIAATPIASFRKNLPQPGCGV